nr:hypothetical protein [Candidatus Sigynarchaeota archaeon]
IVQSSSPITTQNVIILIMIAIVATVAAIAIPRHIKIKKSLNNTNLSAQNVYNSSPGIVITPPRQELPSISEDKPTRPSNISSGKLLHVTRNDLHVILQKPNTTKTHRIYSCQDCGVTIIVDEPTNEISYYCRKCNKLMVIILKCPYCANSITIPQTSQLESDAADILCPVCKERFLSASIPKI